MKIAIDTSPVSESSDSAHKVRGVGAYIHMLVTHLPKFDKKNKYVFVEDKNFPSDADLIHYPYFDPFFITLPSKFQAKTIVTVHDLTPLVFPSHFPSGIRGKIKWLIQKSRLKKADLVITDSDSSKKDVGNIVGISEDKLRTVYLAANPKFRKLSNVNGQLSIVKKFSLPENFLLYVGDATWNKNLTNLVSAVKKTKHKLALAGKVWPPAQRASGPEGSNSVTDISNNPWNDDLKKVLKVIEGDDQFIRLGFVSDEDLVKLYNIATALIMPSIYEGFGLPVLEALECGCPVISSKGGSLVEVGGDAVYYVDYGSEDNIADGIEKIFSDSKLRADFIRRGFTQAKKFSVEKMMKDLIDIYEETYR